MEELLLQINANLEEIKKLMNSQAEFQNVGTLTAQQAAKFLGISYFTLLENINGPVSDDRIPHFRIGAKILFRKEAIIFWMQNQEGTLVGAKKENQEYGKIRKIKP